MNRSSRALPSGLLNLLPRARATARRWLLPVATAGLAFPVCAGVVFDGSIGPNSVGDARSGDFLITQDDGAIAGGNLFHSFRRFDVQAGEQATFSHHAADIRHIVARVTGFESTEIRGALRIRRDAGSGLLPSGAGLWLMNPNGILIGDGAELDAQSSFVFSTANRIGFAGGDSFHAHDLAGGPLLSVADPVGFGFLDRQALPAGVTPGMIRVSVTDPRDANAPLFLSSLTLVGSSAVTSSPGIHFSGDIRNRIDPANPAPGASSQFQATLLDLVALGPGGFVAVDSTGLDAPYTPPNSALGGILIENSNLLLADGAGASSRFSAQAGQMVIANSQLDALAFNRAVPVSLRAGESLTLLGSMIRSGTASGIDAGNIRIDTRNYRQLGGLVSSRNLSLDSATGAPGNLLFGTSRSLPLENFLLEQGQILSIGAGNSKAGDIVINVTGELALSGSAATRASLASFSAGGGASGSILLNAHRIRAEFGDLFSAGFNADATPLINLQAGKGGMLLTRTSLLGASTGGRNGASIGLFSAGDLRLMSGTTPTLIATGTSNRVKGGDIFLSAEGDLSLHGSFDISSTSSGDTGQLGDSGTVFLDGRNISLSQAEGADAQTLVSSLTTGAGTGGTIFLSATETLRVRGQHSFASGTVSAGNSGAVILEAATIDIESEAPVTLSTSSLGAGDAGIISLTARDTLRLAGVDVDSVAAAEGAAGFLLASGNTVDIDDSNFSTSTRAKDAGDVPAQIFLEATDSLELTDTLLLSNSEGLAPAGQITLVAGNHLLLENASLQTATRGRGRTGSILLSSGGDLLLRGAQTELLSNALGNSDAGDVSLLAEGTLDFRDGGFVQTSTLGAGDAGTILLSADRVRLTLARLEGTSERAGGGDIDIFGRDIQVDGNLGAGGIVFIAASSQSSDAAGNGGSITLGDPANPAELVFVRNSGLSASANAGNGGRININADHFLRDARSIFQVTSTLGEPGSLEINAPEQDISAAVAELDVAILDATALIQDRCAVLPGEASSLVIGGQDAVSERYDSYLFSDLPQTDGSRTPSAAVRSDRREETARGWLALAGGGGKCVQVR